MYTSLTDATYLNIFYWSATVYKQPNMYIADNLIYNTNYDMIRIRVDARSHTVTYNTVYTSYNIFACVLLLSLV